MIMDIIIIRDIFTFPLNPPLAKGDLWQGVALLAYGDMMTYIQKDYTIYYLG